MKKAIMTIKIINCEELSCGECEYVLVNILKTVANCKEFQCGLKKTREGDFARCLECIAAEVKE